MSDVDLFRLFASLMLLLLAAHLMGRLFARLRQPPVIGEITGGLLLGPSLFGLLAPGAQEWLFPPTGPAATGLALVYQLGVLLLMFLAGLQMRAVFSRHDGRAVLLIAVVGMVIPFGCGLLLVRVVDLSSVVGEAGDHTALTLVIACAVAITSIPVISRIMMDLGIAGTSFARVVLSVAVLEDIVLNVVIAVALGMVGGGPHDAFGAPALLGVGTGDGAIAYHALVSVAFFGLMAGAGALLRRTAARPHASAAGPGPTAAPTTAARPGADRAGADRAGADRSGAGEGRAPGVQVAVQVAVVLGAGGACVFLGITPMYGAFLVGLMMSWSRGAGEPDPMAAVRGFATGFFIPVYFAIVGLKLDLVHAFDPLLTLAFIAFACVVKAASVYLGARWAGRPRSGALNLAVAMNARGGPGIVLATLAYDARIIDATLFTTLVLTAVITSLMAGGWLESAIRRGLLPRDEDEGPPPAADRTDDKIPAGAR
ncbi:cation:proton antiporter [Streptomyces sp. DH12]|uniref:cation:proton antiporter n=1 Tax=Streptomyces sp. DH12 TaxID=2857010 RepID=UPI001E3C9DB5|nr:cation:proton antiporter [Streptomyces sp. DH12]